VGSPEGRLHGPADGVPRLEAALLQLLRRQEPVVDGSGFVTVEWVTAPTPLLDLVDGAIQVPVRLRVAAIAVRDRFDQRRASSLAGPGDRLRSLLEHVHDVVAVGDLSGEAIGVRSADYRAAGGGLVDGHRHPVLVVL